jgi:paraquat-inducible protein B
MRSESGYFKLGLFVISGIALLVAGVVLLGAGAMFKKTIPVETVTTESVDGLDVGAQVKFRGVPIGTVSKVEPAIWRYRGTLSTVEQRVRLGNQIILELAIDPRTFDTTDLDKIRAIIAASADAGLRARVTSSGLTGPSYVELLFADPKENPPIQITWQPEVPYVPSAPNAISQVVASLQSIATGLQRADLEKVIGHVDQLITDTDKTINDLQVATLRTQVGNLVDEVRGSNGRLRQVLENPNVDRTLQNVSDATGGAKELLRGQDVQAFTADLPKISARRRSTAQRIDELANSDQVTKAVDGLSTTTTNAGPAMVELRRSLRELNGMLATQRQDIESVIGNLRRVLENTAALTGDLKQNPSRAVFGEPPPHRRPGE